MDPFAPSSPLRYVLTVGLEQWSATFPLSEEAAYIIRRIGSVRVHTLRRGRRGDPVFLQYIVGSRQMRGAAGEHERHHSAVRPRGL